MDSAFVGFTTMRFANELKRRHAWRRLAGAVAAFLLVSFAGREQAAHAADRKCAERELRSVFCFFQQLRPHAD